jgi:hypothetical protein
MNNRSPPLDHRFLYRDRARRSSVDDALKARDIILRANRRIELQHAYEMGRHELSGGNSIVLDEAKHIFRIKLLHHHDRSTEFVDGHAEA